MPSGELEKSEMSTLAGLRGVMRAVREIDAEMPAQTLTALLEIANNPGMTMKDLEDRLELSTAAMSRLISRLTKWKSEKGNGERGLDFVERRPNPQDRRYQIVTLTPSGLAFVRRLLKAVVSHN